VTRTCQMIVLFLNEVQVEELNLSLIKATVQDPVQRRLHVEMFLDSGFTFVWSLESERSHCPSDPNTSSRELRQSFWSGLPR